MAVAAVFLGALIVSAGAVILVNAGWHRAPDVLHAMTLCVDAGWIWPCVGILITVILVAWLWEGNGLGSPLWQWLPPLVLARKAGKPVRLTLLVLLILGTLLGAFSSQLGLAPL